MWTRHGRRLSSEVHSWESMVNDPYQGVVSWSVPENITVVVTLFHGNKMTKWEDKNWMFVVENVSKIFLLFFVVVHSLFLWNSSIAKCVLYCHIILSLCISFVCLTGHV